MFFDKDQGPDELEEADEFMTGQEESTLTWHQEDNT